MITRWGPFTSCAKCGHSPHPGAKCGPPAESAGTQLEPTDEELTHIDLLGVTRDPEHRIRAGRRALYRAGVASQAARVEAAEFEAAKAHSLTTPALLAAQRGRLEASIKASELEERIAELTAQRDSALERAKAVDGLNGGLHVRVGELESALRMCVAMLDCYEWYGPEGGCVWCRLDDHAGDCSHVEAVTAGRKALGEK